jgi:hypothetical protein
VKTSDTSSGSPHPQEEQVLHSCRIRQFSFGFPQQEPVGSIIVLVITQPDCNSVKKMRGSIGSSSAVIVRIGKIVYLT